MKILITEHTLSQYEELYDYLFNRFIHNRELSYFEAARAIAFHIMEYHKRWQNYGGRFELFEKIYGKL